MLRFLFFALLVLLPACDSQKALEWLLIIHSREGTLTEGTLVLKDVDSIVTTYLRAPQKKTHIVSLRELVAGWNANFTTPPEANLSYLGKDKKHKNTSLILKAPTLEGDSLTFSIQFNGTPFMGEIGECVLFFKGACIFECPHIDGVVK